MSPLALLATGSVPPTVDASLPSLRDPARTFAVRRVAPETIARWRREPRLRRASPIAHFLTEACTQAAAVAPPGSRLGLVGAFFTGPAQYSRAFLQPVQERGPTAASPALFPDTVYNSALSHAAAVLGITGPAYALVGDDAAFVSALAVARTWLALGTVDRVLVAGAEELDAISVEAYAAAGWLRRGYLPAEGAAALLVGPENESPLHLAEWIELPSHRPAAEATARRRALVERFGSAPTHPEPPATAPHAFTASAGWLVQEAAAALRAPGEVWVPIIGREHGVAAVRLRHL